MVVTIPGASLTILLLSLVLLAALVLLAPLCDEYLVTDLLRIGARRGWSEGTLGSGFLAVTSSAPELMIALVSVLVGRGAHAAVGAGTIIGSALFNLLVIVGVCAWIERLRLPWPTLLRECVAYAAGIGWLIWAVEDGAPEGRELLVGLGLYALYVLALTRVGRGESAREPEPKVEATTPPRWRPDRWLLRLLFRPVASAPVRLAWAIVLLAGLSWLLVESAIRLAESFGVPESLVALTVLAIGTSVPDLYSSIAAANRGRGTVAVTNAIGSNVFDILPGLALPWLVGLAIWGGGAVTLTEGPILEGAWVLIGSVAILLAAFGLVRGGLGRFGGTGLVILYLGYLGWALAGEVMRGAGGG